MLHPNFKFCIHISQSQRAYYLRELGFKEIISTEFVIKLKIRPTRNLHLSLSRNPWPWVPGLSQNKLLAPTVWAQLLVAVLLRVVFNWVSKEISELLWFIITSLSDWFKVLAPLFQPIRSETKTNHGSCVRIFPRFVSATWNYLEFWLVNRIVSVLFNWPK